MSANSEKANNESPLEEIQYFPEDLIQELELFQVKEIKTGIIKCNKAIIKIDNHEIDLQNLDIETIEKLKFSTNSNENPEGKKSTSSSSSSKFYQKSLKNISNQFLNFLGHSITSKQLGNKYQSIPQKLIVFQENDFPLPEKNFPNEEKEEKDEEDENPSQLLIVTCPTVCNGGEINFPKFKKSFHPQLNQNILSYVLFDANTKFQISKITNGTRALIVYKIFPFSMQFEMNNELIVSDTRKLKTILKNITETNVLIPMTKGNRVKKICDSIKLKYRQVYSAKECPKIVYGELDRNEMEFYYKGWEECDVDFYSLVRNSSRFSVGKIINFAKPQIINDIVVRYRKYGTGPEESNYEVDYYSFILINPSEIPVSDSDPSEPDPSESDSSDSERSESESDDLNDDLTKKDERQVERNSARKFLNF